YAAQGARAYADSIGLGNSRALLEGDDPGPAEPRQRPRQGLLPEGLRPLRQRLEHAPPVHLSIDARQHEEIIPVDRLLDLAPRRRHAAGRAVDFAVEQRLAVDDGEVEQAAERRDPGSEIEDRAQRGALGDERVPEHAPVEARAEEAEERVLRGLDDGLA